ncbi:hypothetical protein PDENDC454_02410 [Paenibacillus dendritiformis C454]|uniref:Uncharacterized protein n=2 Tax=Paenibacillus dendritiformis TaxID=130049 RepID=H3SAE9_9BACL|nr:hypothetical protein [Paenibacillus dendritiformis]EHQ63952.1 hypothetical protein PDENDC454_02410 [Paenibacillus dendritiformis C454]
MNGWIYINNRQGLRRGPHTLGMTNCGKMTEPAEDWPFAIILFYRRRVAGIGIYLEKKDIHRKTGLHGEVIESVII